MIASHTVLELRQYTLVGGQRDVLIALFEAEFIAPQDTLGAQVLGTFRDLNDIDRFIWLRGFADMETRKAALEAFYGGTVWRTHRDAANATMIDSDNVLLLKPLTPLRPGGRGGLIRIAIHSLRGVEAKAFAEFFDAAILPRVTACGGHVMARYVTEPRPNTFPALPVREDETVFVWFSRFDDPAHEQEFSRRLAEESGWRDGIAEALLPALMRKPEVLRLLPTDESPLG